MEIAVVSLARRARLVVAERPTPFLDEGDGDVEEDVRASQFVTACHVGLDSFERYVQPEIKLIRRGRMRLGRGRGPSAPEP